jgi:hypothetical protein
LGDLDYFSNAVREGGGLQLDGYWHHSPMSVIMRGSKTVGCERALIPFASIQTDVSHRRSLSILFREIQVKNFEIWNHRIVRDD